jgi:hypothetical protein
LRANKERESYLHRLKKVHSKHEQVKVCQPYHPRTSEELLHEAVVALAKTLHEGQEVLVDRADS